MKGEFVDYNGAPKNYYRGFFIPGANGAVEQFYMLSPSQPELKANEQRYKEIVDSIRWR